MHGCDCGLAGHEAPPFCGYCVMVKVRLWEPPPHEAEQPLNPVHWPWQSTGGHACSLHACRCGLAGQAAPPFWAGTATLKTCDCDPPPHATEQEPKPDHEPWQSTGQACWLQPTTCGLDGHAAPPNRACRVTVNVCDFWPPPQVAEHALKPDHVPWQSSGGHACSLHACDRVKAAGQAAPPLAACTLMVYVCD